MGIIRKLTNAVGLTKPVHRRKKKTTARHKKTGHRQPAALREYWAKKRKKR